MSSIFISYRREDSAGHAGRLFDYLRQRSEVGTVFMDVSAIEPGVDFVDSIEQAVGRCDLLLAVIGKNWLHSLDESGQRRLDDPHDFIRLETATALRRGIRVIPVMVQGAQMPRAEELPVDLRPLARRQAVELRDSRWEDDVGYLIDRIALAMRSVGGPAGISGEEQSPSPRHHTPRLSGNDAPSNPAHEINSADYSTGASISLAKRPIFAGFAILIIAAAAFGAWFVFQESHPRVDSTSNVGVAKNPSKPTRTGVKVFIHTSEERDRTILEEVGNALRARGFEIPDTRLSSAPTDGDIRFFFPQDREESERLKSTVEEELSTRGYRVSLKLLERDGTKFQHAQPGKIEVWLPPLRKATSVIR